MRMAVGNLGTQAHRMFGPGHRNLLGGCDFCLHVWSAWEDDTMKPIAALMAKGAYPSIRQADTPLLTWVAQSAIGAGIEAEWALVLVNRMLVEQDRIADHDGYTVHVGNG